MRAASSSSQKEEKKRDPYPVDTVSWRGDGSGSGYGYDLRQQLFKRCPQLYAFITAYARQRLNAHIDAVGRGRVELVATDGILLDLTTDCSLPELSGGLGGLKLEARGKAEICHVNKYRIIGADGTAQKVAGLWK